MLYVIQNDKGANCLDIDIMVLKDELRKQKYIHEIWNLSSDELNDDIQYPENIDMKKGIPIGDIDFVSKYLKRFHCIKNMNPIEVPNELRTHEFLGRNYKIVDATNIPKEGRYFVKDVSKLKTFSYMGDLGHLFYDEIFDEPKDKFDLKLHLDKNHLFQVSNIVNILSEYRVFVLNDKIKGIQYYDGDPTVMPSPDEINKIQKMILLYMRNNKRPDAYALDIAVIKTNNSIGRELIVLELCPFACLGTYGLVGSFLPEMYRYGFEWYIRHNTPIEKFNC